MSEKLSRRQVMRKGAMGAAGMAFTSLASCTTTGTHKGIMPGPGTLGANDRIRAAVAGIHGQGGSHIGRLSRDKGVELVYVIDPDSRLHAGRIKDSEKASEGRSKPKGIQDVRRVLEDKSIDAISIATPNHWHALITIWACQAGKDVYVEKPMSHNIHEGRIAVEAARKYKRVVQHGTQSRSDKDWAKIAAVVKSGQLGKLRVSRGLCYKSGGSGHNTRGDIGFAPVTAPPPELDFNLWQGPAKFINYHTNLVHYRWHWFWATGNGDLGNQGVHEMDKARWFIPGATLPKSVIAFGGRLGTFDQGEVANTHIAIMDFGETKLIFETRGLPSPAYKGQGIGNILHLDAGTIVGKQFFPNGSQEPAPLPEVELDHEYDTDHFGSWLKAIRSRNTKDLYADVLEGHYSASLCHLANMSIRLGNKIPFRPQPDALACDSDAKDVLDRTEAYLKENGIDIEHSGQTLGRKLIVDAKTESIVGDAEANALLTRDYRKEFAVPSRI